MKYQIIAAAALLASAIPARAAFLNLGAAGNYNIYTTGNFTQSGTDSGGSVAVGGAFAPASNGTYTVHGSVFAKGNYTNSGGTIDGSIVGQTVTFSNETVGGSVSATQNLIISGGATPSALNYAGTASVPSYMNGELHKVAASSIAYPVDFDATNNYLRSFAAIIAGTAATPGITITFNSSNLKLSGTGSDFYLFHVTAAELSGMNDFALNVAGATPGVTPTVVIDVAGAAAGSYSFHNNGISLAGTDADHMLFNFNDATSVATNGIGIRGSMLAPNAEVNFASGNIDGTMIARTLKGSGEARSFEFTGSIPLSVPQGGTSVPETTSAALLATPAMLVLRRRRAT